MTFIKLTASGGHKLTQADENLPVLERIFANEAMLGVGDNPDNWVEISDDKVAEYREQQAAAEAEQADE